MLDELEKTIQTLASSQSGWVSRRDAAENLGKAAALAYSILTQYENEPDVDVQRAVYKALEVIRQSIGQGTPSITSVHKLTLADLVKSLEKTGKRTVAASGHGYSIKFAFPKDREQTVHASPYKDQDGVEHIRLISPCGAASQELFEKSLNVNSKLTCGSIAISEIDGQPCLALVRFVSIADVTPREFKTIVKQIGFYADWLEKQLSRGGDEF